MSETQVSRWLSQLHNFQETADELAEEGQNDAEIEHLQDALSYAIGGMEALGMGWPYWLERYRARVAERTQWEERSAAYLEGVPTYVDSLGEEVYFSWDTYDEVMRDLAFELAELADEAATLLVNGGK